MKSIELSFSRPEENLAFDDALLKCLSSGGLDDEVLRFWESPVYFVVGGAGTDIDDEVIIEECRTANVPVLRRCSGGGSVVQGPGCLNYCLVLDGARTPVIADIASTNEYVLTHICNALVAASGLTVTIKGVSDLACGQWKISGNAQKRSRGCAMMHGTILYNFNLSLIGRFLKEPTNRPEWRGNRSHAGFVSNIPVDPLAFRCALIDTLDAKTPIVCPENIPEKIRACFEDALKSPRYRYIS